MGFNILVTGGAGYLGSILLPELLAQGHKVTVLDNFMFRQNSLAQLCINPGFTVVKGDVRSAGIVNPLLAQADIIIPLAALVGAPLCNKDPVGATTTNRDAIFAMMARLSLEQRVLMPTTNSAYGSGDENNHCDENSPLNPISHYAREKVEVEQRLLAHDNAISFRLATVFGMAPRMRTDLLVNDFVYRAVYDRAVVLFESHFKRNYIHVRDVSRVFLHGIDHFDAMKGEIFNVGLSNANISKWELCEAIKKQIPEFVFVEAGEGKDPDQRNYIVSNQKIEKTDFEPTYSLGDGITELMKGYIMIRNSCYGNL
ncbi:MAG: NAD(P)-dependent oxidoreductase [Gammaproteobacteria bacterium]|nr:NAD(P)-dependent oxidoreductase [Gammaproteobacteria bacterium]MCF6230162.1 NAD(P)-dependent oxidoreductase [Gammaproteobacteria bacterium]